MNIARIALLLLLFTPATACAGSVERVPVRDNTLFEDAEGDTSSGSGGALFCGRISQGRVRRGLIAFDVAAALPADARLDSARLVLHMASSSDPLPRTLQLHRALADWGEGASASEGGGGAPAQAGDATWLHAFYPAVFWATPGGDFAAPASASLTVLSAAADYAWQSAALADDVRAWLDEPAANFGWILLGDESAPGTARRFDSRESTAESDRPTLVLFYSIPTPTPLESWGRLKAHYR